MEELCRSFSISSYGLQTLQRVTADTEDTFAFHKRRWTTSHAFKTYHRSRLGICTKYDQKAPAPRNIRFALECMMATTRIEFNTDLYREASPSPIPSSPLSSLEDCNCETNHPVYFMTDEKRSLSEGSPTNINMPPTSKSNWAPTNEEFMPVFMSHLDPNHSESEFGGVSVTDQCSSNSSKCVAASHHEPLLSSLLYMSDMRDQSFRMVNSILDQDPLNLSNESGLTSPAAFSSPTSSFMPDFLDEDKMRKEDLTRSQLQANAQGMHPINSYLGSEESQYYGHHSSERSEVDDFPAFNATGYPASITRPFHPSTHEPSIQQSSFQSSFQYLRARELDNEAYGGGEMPANSFTPPSNYNNYPEALLHEDLYNQRRSTEQRSYSLPAQLREVTYDPKVERSQSFSGQTVHEQQSQYGRQSTYSPQPQSFRRGTEEMKYGDLQHQAQSQVYSQLVAEAQQQVRSKMILTQRRAQDQHLQQQQFQQLHRLHTQQLKQAKQRGLEAKQQSTDVFVQMPRLSYGGSVYQVQFKCNHRYVVLMDSNLQGVELGAFVIVEADRGEDLGVIVHIAPRDSPLAMSLHAASNYLPPGSEEQMKKILRVATLQERADLPRKAKDEMDILAICREMAPEKYQLSISLVDAEYQFDRHKLVLYYSAARRIDFREFVRDLHAVYKIRIWMQPVDVTNSFRPNEIASRALASGFLIQSPGSIQSLQTRSPLTYMPDGMNNANTTILHHPNVAVNGSSTGGAYPMRGNLNQGQHSLRSCPPSALGTYPGPSPVLIQNQGYYGARVKQQPSPYFLTGK